MKTIYLMMALAFLLAFGISSTDVVTVVPYGRFIRIGVPSRGFRHEYFPWEYDFDRGIHIPLGRNSQLP